MHVHCTVSRKLHVYLYCRDIQLFQYEMKLRCLVKSPIFLQCLVLGLQSPIREEISVLLSLNQSI